MSDNYRGIELVECAKNLISCLQDINIRVSNRTEGRTTDQIECYLICRLLSTLAETRYISYPLSLIKRERPDFLLICGDFKVGIEVTEATSQEYSHYEALYERREDKSKGFREPGRFSYGKKFSSDKKEELLRKDVPVACASRGDDPERKFILYIKDAISRKCEKFKSYDKFKENWLLIHENIPESCYFFGKKTLLSFLEEALDKDCYECFDKVFIATTWLEDAGGLGQPVIIILSNKGVDWFVS